MIGLAAPQEGVAIWVQTPSKDDPAVSVAEGVILANLACVEATAKLAQHCDVITFENEFVDIEKLKSLANQGVCFYPRLESITPLLDKYQQRTFLASLGLPVPRFKAYDKPEDFQDFSFPLVLKARRHGYDGQGTVIIESFSQLRKALARFKDTPLLIEEYIPFERELAVIAARSLNGDIKIYPVVQTYQSQQICRWVLAPAQLETNQVLQIEHIAEKILVALDYVGVLGIEFFLTKEGKIVINEVAPRTHNSGHYTIVGCETSQFAMQLQAITGKSLGETKLKSDGVLMINLLGNKWGKEEYLSERAEIERLGGVIHWYGKSESRPGRKLGHVTFLLKADSRESLDAQAQSLIQKVETIWYGGSKQA